MAWPHLWCWRLLCIWYSERLLAHQYTYLDHFFLSARYFLFHLVRGCIPFPCVDWRCGALYVVERVGCEVRTGNWPAHSAMHLPQFKKSKITYRVLAAVLDSCVAQTTDQRSYVLYPMYYMMNVRNGHGSYIIFDAEHCLHFVIRKITKYTIRMTKRQLYLLTYCINVFGIISLT